MNNGVTAVKKNQNRIKGRSLIVIKAIINKSAGPMRREHTPTTQSME